MASVATRVSAKSTGGLAFAQDLLGSGRADQALSAAKNGLLKSPAEPRLLRVAADACRQLGMTSDEAVYLERLAHTRPNDGRAWAKLSRALGGDKGSLGAIGTLRAALERHPASLGLRQQLSTVYIDARQHDSALRLWDGHMSTEEGSLAAAGIMVKARNFAEAEALYARILERNPAHLDAARGLARTAQRSSNWPLAIERWRRVAELAPDDPSPLYQVAGMLRICGELGQGELVIQRAMELAGKATPKRFWGGSGEPMNGAKTWGLEERVSKALSDQRDYLAKPGDRYHPDTGNRFNAELEAAYTSQKSSVLQFVSEAKFLARFLEGNNVRTFFEVGMRHGAFSKLLDQLLNFDHIGGSEFIVTPRLREMMENPRYKIFAGDHHSEDYKAWRRSLGKFDFVFIDGGHSYNDVMRDFIREREFRPRFIGFHDVWNTACLGAKRMWDEIGGKVVFYCNTDPEENMLINNRPRNSGEFFDNERELHGYCAGIGIVEIK